MAASARRCSCCVSNNLHTALERAVDAGQLAHIPMEPLKAPRAANAEMKTLTADQAKYFLSVTDGRADRLQALWAVLIHTGMRAAEACGLKWQDIDFERRRIAIRRGMHRYAGKGIVETPTKNDGSRRPIPFGDELAGILEGHRDIQAHDLTERGVSNPRNYVFTTLVGGPLEPTNIADAFKRRLKWAGLDPVRFHDLRHTAGTLMMQEKVSLPVLQRVLGHSNLSTTSRYLHFSGEQEREAIETLEKRLKNPTRRRRASD